MIKRRKRRRRQVYRLEKVVMELGGASFYTDQCTVCEGNFKVGDWVITVYDQRSRRWLPVYKKRKASTPEAPPRGVIHAQKGAVLYARNATAVWEKNTNYIYIKCQESAFNCYIDLSASFDNIYGMICLTGLHERIFNIGGFLYNTGYFASLFYLVIFKLGGKTGESTTYKDQTYWKRSFEFIRHEFQRQPSTLPIRTYPVTIYDSDFSFRSYHAENYDENLLNPIVLLLYLGAPYRSMNITLSMVKFHIIAWQNVLHTVLTTHNGHDSAGGLQNEWQMLYNEGSGWNLVPDPNEETNFEIGVVGHTYDYEAFMAYDGIILRDKDWEWESKEKNEFYLTNWYCWPILKPDMTGVGGWLKIYFTHVGHHGGQMIRDVSRTVLIVKGDPNANPPIPNTVIKKKTYDREYQKEYLVTDFQCIWYRGSDHFWGDTLYYPYRPIPNLMVGGGLLQRCGGYDAHVGAIHPGYTYGQGWSY